MKGIKGFPKGKNHHEWKGDKVGYTALHAWIERMYGKPKRCSHCGSTTEKKYEWASVSHKYKRDIMDWVRLCTKCHIRMDGRLGEGNGQSKLTKTDVKLIRYMYSTNEFSYSLLAIYFNVGKSTICRVIKNKNWINI